MWHICRLTVISKHRDSLCVVVSKESLQNYCQTCWICWETGRQNTNEATWRELSNNRRNAVFSSWRLCLRIPPSCLLVSAGSYARCTQTVRQLILFIFRSGPWLYDGMSFVTCALWSTVQASFHHDFITLCYKPICMFFRWWRVTLNVSILSGQHWASCEVVWVFHIVTDCWVTWLSLECRSAPP